MMGTWGFIVVFSPLLYMFEMSHNIVLKESKKDDADKLKCQRIEKELPGKYEPPPKRALRIINQFHLCMGGPLLTSYSLHQFFFFFFNLFIYLFLAALDLRCCARAFSSCGEPGYSSLQCAGFSLRWLLLLQSTV